MTSRDSPDVELCRTGMAVVQRALSAQQGPSLKLLDHTAAVVAGEPRYTLLDDRIVAYESILAEYRRARRSKSEHSVVVVKGGPGTGESVVALNLVGTLSKLRVDVRHATGTKRSRRPCGRFSARASSRSFATSISSGASMKEVSTS